MQEDTQTNTIISLCCYLIIAGIEINSAKGAANAKVMESKQFQQLRKMIDTKNTQVF